MDTLWREALVYRIASEIIFRTVPKWYLGRVTGLEHLPRETSFILIANHTSPFDHLLLASLVKIVCDKKLYFLAKKELWERRLFRIWHNSMGSIPLNREVPDRTAYRHVIKLLSAGEIVCVYPEGACGDGTRLLSFKAGAFRMATHQEVPIVPVGIVNSHQILKKGAIIPRPRRADIAIGLPLSPDPVSVRYDSGLRTLMKEAYTAVEYLALNQTGPTTQPEAIKASARHLLNYAEELAKRALQPENKQAKESLAKQVLRLSEIAKRNELSVNRALNEVSAELRATANDACVS